MQLLVGPLPMQTYGPAKPDSNTTLPVSPHYARLLAELAYQRGFDGYLLNFEYPLFGGVQQARALTMWIALLEQELKRKVGPHAEAMWYVGWTMKPRIHRANRTAGMTASSLPASYDGRID